MTGPELETGRRRVVIVDDNPDVVDPLNWLLAKHGFTRVRTASSVEQALALLTEELPDVLLLDLSLSLMDDHALLRTIRQAPHWSALPVLVLTGRHSGEAIQGATREGATGFLPQPLNGLEIIYKIQQAMRDNVPRAAELTDLLRPEPDPPPAAPGAAPTGITPPRTGTRA